MTAKMSQERKRGGGKVDENPGGRLVSKVAMNQKDQVPDDRKD
jgi:hypothetical protein